MAESAGKGIPSEWRDDPFFKALIALREARWSQERIAREADVSLRTVVRWLHGNTLPNLPQVRKIEALAKKLEPVKDPIELGMELAFKLLDEMGVTGLYGVTFTDEDDHTLRTFHLRYDSAFEGDRIVVAVQRLTRQLFIVENVEQLWDNVSKFEPQGIDMVLAIPRELWDKIRPTITRMIHDLTVAPA